MPNKEFEIDSYTGVCEDISIIIIQIVEKIRPWLSSEEDSRRRRDEYKIRTEDYSPRQSYEIAYFIRSKLFFGFSYKLLSYS